MKYLWVRERLPQLQRNVNGMTAQANALLVCQLKKMKDHLLIHL